MVHSGYTTQNYYIPESINLLTLGLESTPKELLPPPIHLITIKL